MLHRCETSGVAGYLTDAQHTLCQVHDPGGLAFTGFDAGLCAAVGLGLLAVGVLTRRLSRMPSTG